jgi:hypothetical protein
VTAEPAAGGGVKEWDCSQDPFARVSLSSGGPVAVVDATGGFELGRVLARPHVVRVLLPSGACRGWTGVIPGDGRLRLQLPRNALVEGTIRGAPARSRCRVTLEGDGAANTWGREAVQRPCRAFRFDDVSVGSYRVVAEAGTQHASAPVEVREGMEAVKVDLVFRAQVAIRGRVVGPGGDPVAGTYVTVRLGRSAPTKAEQLSGADGAFTIKSAPEGEVVLEVALPRDGGSEPREWSFPRTIPATSAREPFDVGELRLGER